MGEWLSPCSMHRGNGPADRGFFLLFLSANRCFRTCLVSDHLPLFRTQSPRPLLRTNLLAVRPPWWHPYSALRMRLPGLVGRKSYHHRVLVIPYSINRAFSALPSPSPLAHSYSDVHRTYAIDSSAKDQLMGTSVAIKKIMKPFSTPVLSKRTYRELKLLKHIQHENIIALSDVFISPLEDIYFVTELLGTDLHRLLTSRPLEKQFIQYFLYQILVSLGYIRSIPHEFDF